MTIFRRSAHLKSDITVGTNVNSKDQHIVSMSFLTSLKKINLIKMARKNYLVNTISLILSKTEVTN
jgi:hypothetical protein